MSKVTVNVAVVEGSFAWAMVQLEGGESIRRAGWNGKGQSITKQVPDINSKMTLPYAYIETVDGHLVPWTASQGDLFAEDWEVADE